jgi:hypothetical protein
VTFTLPPIDNDAMQDAARVYRAAFELETRLEEEWEARRAEWEKLDEFDDLRVERENQLWFAEQLRSEARDLYLATTLGRIPFSRDRFNTEMFAKINDPRLAALLPVMDKVRTRLEARKDLFF